MKKAIIILIMVLLFSVVSIANAAQWLGCDIPPAEQEVTEYAITIDGGAEVIVPYQENTAQDAVLLWDITSLTNATFSVFAINSQGRRSAVPAPFVLLAAPSGPLQVRIVQP
jgi:hypothetical protein